jgi:hypothetical protein
MWISMVWIIWSTLRLLCIEVLIGKRDCMIVIRTDDLMNDYDAMGVYTMQCMIELRNTLRLCLHSRSSFGLHVSALAFSPRSSCPNHHRQCGKNADTA